MSSTRINSQHKSETRLCNCSGDQICYLNFKPLKIPSKTVDFAKSQKTPYETIKVITVDTTATVLLGSFVL